LLAERGEQARGPHEERDEQSDPVADIGCSAVGEEYGGGKKDHYAGRNKGSLANGEQDGC